MTSGNVMPLAWFFSLRISLATWYLLGFRRIFRIPFSLSVKTGLGIKTGIALNLCIYLPSMDIVTMLILLICYHGLTFHLNIFSYTLKKFIISFNWRNIALQFCFWLLPYNNVNQSHCGCLITKPCPPLLRPHGL